MPNHLNEKFNRKYGIMISLDDTKWSEQRKSTSRAKHKNVCQDQKNFEEERKFLEYTPKSFWIHNQTYPKNMYSDLNMKIGQFTEKNQDVVLEKPQKSDRNTLRKIKWFELSQAVYKQNILKKLFCFSFV